MKYFILFWWSQHVLEVLKIWLTVIVCFVDSGSAAHWAETSSSYLILDYLKDVRDLNQINYMELICIELILYYAVV